jgi:hypothetical protein
MKVVEEEETGQSAMQDSSGEDRLFLVLPKERFIPWQDCSNSFLSGSYHDEDSTMCALKEKAKRALADHLKNVKRCAR